MIQLILLITFAMITIVLLGIYLISKHMMIYKPKPGKIPILKQELLVKLLKLDKNPFTVKQAKGYDFIIS